MIYQRKQGPAVSTVAVVVFNILAFGLLGANVGWFIAH